MTNIRVISLVIMFVCWNHWPIVANMSGPRIEVFKGTRQLLLFDGDNFVKSYRVALGTNPIPPKVKEGDRATPEGSYYICMKNPESQFHLSLGISYPNIADAKRGLRDGLISASEYEAIAQAAGKREKPPWKTKLGGEVFVHGNGSASDWTWGCIALDNSDIEELYRLIPVGTSITIYP